MQSTYKSILETDEMTVVTEYNPLIIDEIPINFEELFIIEVENRGYLKWKTYLNIT